MDRSEKWHGCRRVFSFLAGPLCFYYAACLQLGDDIRLLGYNWDPDGSTLTLYWQPDQPLTTDYFVLVHLLNSQGRLVWGSDGPPPAGLYPTSAWRRDEILAAPRLLALDGLAPGEYTLAAGLCHPDMPVRLPVTDPGGRAVAGDAVILTRLTWPQSGQTEAKFGIL